MKLFVKISIFIIVLIVAACLFFFAAQTLSKWAVSQAPSGPQVCFRNSCFSVELATTPQQQEQGLMYRQSLGKNNGMLFIFPNEGVYPFWMKNTLIPLDMIWIDKSDKVVFISENVQPCKVEICPITIPAAEATYVLEVNAGAAKEIGLKVGDKLDIK